MIQPHELADMRRAADKMPHDTQQKFHALLDAYEDREERQTTVEQLEDVESKATAAIRALRAVYPSSPSERAVIAKEFGEPVSEDAWAECLADCDTPEERASTVDDELKRAREAERKLRARLETIEEAIESALSELE